MRDAALSAIREARALEARILDVGRRPSHIFFRCISKQNRDHDFLRTRLELVARATCGGMYGARSEGVIPFELGPENTPFMWQT